MTMGKNKYRTLAGNMLILTIGQFSSKLLVYVMLKFYTSMLGEAGFGTMNIIVSTAGLLISVVTLSISDGVVRFSLEKNNNGKNGLFYRRKRLSDRLGGVRAVCAPHRNGADA